jgi:predicted TIM-barrel fold metal-dependent hydrolase
MLIDCHTHAFMSEDMAVLRERLTLLDASLPDDSPHKWRLHGDGGLEGLAQAMTQAGVDRYVLLPVTGRKERASDMNRWSAAAAAADPRLIPFGVLHPLGPVEEDVPLLLELGLRGVKLHPFIQRFSIDHRLTHELLARLEGQGLPVLVDTLFVSGLVQAKPHMGWVVEAFNFKGCEPAEIARAAAAHPGINFIAAHGGSLYGWDQLDPLMELDNVYFDISYLHGLIAPDQLVRIIRRKGPEKVMYGTDAPWRDAVAFRQWFEEMPLSAGEREQVAAGTLLALLGEV